MWQVVTPGEEAYARILHRLQLEGMNRMTSGQLRVIVYFSAASPMVPLLEHSASSLEAPETHSIGFFRASGALHFIL
jgi:hypothetical protein